MAENLDDGEFWLPPQFLSDDDDNSNLTAKNDDVSRFMFLSSSSETESDEEDQLAELTRRVALGLDLDLNTSAKPKGVFGGGSPQSTLSAFGSSGKGSSPNGAVPPHANTWDLLREAAGEVERIQLNGENVNDRYGYNFPKANAVNSNGLFGLGFYPPQSLSQHQFQISQFEMMRKQQMAKQQQQRQMVPPHNRGRNNNNVNVNVVGMGLSASAWHPPPPPHGSGMRAVFLAGKRESSGTGVFLPRCSVHSRNNNNNNDSRKKPGCNTVYVPDRVVQALNLNSKGMVVGGHMQQQHKPHFNGENGLAVSRVKNNNSDNHYGYSHFHHLHHQKPNNLKHQHQPLVVNHEIHLPQEWTY